MHPSSSDRAGSDRRELVVEHVLRCVEAIPPGRVAAYGVIGRIVGIGPRQVGSIMRHYARESPWWRVTNHAGDFSGGLLSRARAHWEVEGIRVKGNGLGCRYSDYGADESRLAADYRVAAGDLPVL